MLTTTALDHLRRHQDTLSALLDETAVLLSGSEGADRAALAHTRWAMLRCARAYQLFKHGEIFAPAIARGRPAQVVVAEEMRRACLQVSADYEAHVRRWGARDVADEWDLYRAETWAIVRRIRRHIVVERQQVERLLAGAERTRQLGRSGHEGRPHHSHPAAPGGPLPGRQ